MIPGGASALIPSENISRTGYDERDLMTYEAKSVKFGTSLNYRPFGNDRLEIIWNSKFGVGNTIYQGINRYNIKDFFMEQHKLEIRGKNFFVRGYMTSEDAGNSYDTRFAAININRAWKDDSTWFGQYTGAYLQGTLGGLTSDQAHALARQTAETGRLLPGSAEFQNAFNQSVNDPDLTTGAKFQDNSKIYHSDWNYNFQDQVDWADIQVGGSFRQYSLNSSGTIYTDYDGPIEYNEYGVYTQLQKKFLEDEGVTLDFEKCLADKAIEDYVSPRISLNYSAGDKKQHNIRGSFQTGFRNPDTQALFIGFDVGRAILVGSSPDNLDRRLPGTDLTGQDVYYNSYTRTSVEAFAATGDPTLLEATVTPLVQQEKVTAFDIGYRGKIGPINLR